MSRVFVGTEDVKPLACRGCLAVSRPLRPLERATAALYGELVGTAVHLADIYPKFVCSYCRALLLKFNAFRDNCRSSQTKLHDLHSAGIPITIDLIKSEVRGHPYPNLYKTYLQMISFDINVDDDEESTKLINAQEVVVEDGHKAKYELDPCSPYDNVLDEFIVFNNTSNYTRENHDFQSPGTDNIDSIDHCDVYTKIEDTLTDTKRKKEKDLPNKMKGKMSNAEDSSMDSNEDLSLAQLGKIVTNSKQSKLTKNSKIKKKITQKKSHKGSSLNKIEHVKIDRSIELKSGRDMMYENRRLEAEQKCNVKFVVLSKEEQIQQVMSRKDSANYKQSAYKCEICYLGFASQTGYNNHRAKHDVSEGSYPCEVCSLRFPTDIRLKKHTLSCHKFNYTCNQCGRVSKTRDTAQTHYKWHKGVKYDCKICGKTFDKPTSVLGHMHLSHGGTVPCSICGLKFIGQKGLQHHLRLAHKEAVGAVCSDCNTQFHNVSALQRHRSVGCDVTRSTCVVCGEGLTTGQLLEEHVKDKHDTGYSCEMCGKKLFDISKYKIHLAHHYYPRSARASIKGEFICEMCGVCRTTKQGLELHIRIHTGERPYQCHHCTKTFRVKSTLQTHISIKHGTDGARNKYACSVCHKAFFSKTNRDRHQQRIHEKLRPFSCEVCESTYFDKCTLRMHIKTKHRGVPWPKRERRRPAREQIDEG